MKTFITTKLYTWKLLRWHIIYSVYFCHNFKYITWNIVHDHNMTTFRNNLHFGIYVCNIVYNNYRIQLYLQSTPQLIFILEYIGTQNFWVVPTAFLIFFLSYCELKWVSRGKNIKKIRGNIFEATNKSEFLSVSFECKSSMEKFSSHNFKYPLTIF